MGIAYDDLPDHIKKQVDRVKPKFAVKTQAKALPHAHSMNQTEQKYAARLKLMKREGEIKDWKFEPFNIRLAKNCFYKPDFVVVMPDDTIQVHEVKGYWTDDALVKIKVAAETLPWFLFKSVRLKQGRWEERIFNSH